MCEKKNVVQELMQLAVGEVIRHFDSVLFTFVTETMLIFFPLNNLSTANSETLISMEGQKKSRQLFKESPALTDSQSDWLRAP